MGDKTKAFSFQLELTSPDENEIPEKLRYSIIDNGVEDAEIPWQTWNDGEEEQNEGIKYVFF